MKWNKETKLVELTKEEASEVQGILVNLLSIAHRGLTHRAKIKVKQYIDDLLNCVLDEAMTGKETIEIG